MTQNVIIEVGSGANPLTLENLFKTLRSATSVYPVQVQSGTAQLETWQKTPTFYPLLQDIFIDSSLPLEIRYLAIIQLKQGVDKFWRKTAANNNTYLRVSRFYQNAVSMEDKARVRSRLIESGINEANRQLSLHNAIVISKIVRHEYPGDWVDPITSLTEVLQRATEESNWNPMIVSRCLTIILHCVKELSTARLLKSRASLQQASPELIRVIGRLYLVQVQNWASFLEHGGNDEGGAMEKIEISLKALKTLRRLFIFGYDNPNRDNDVAEFWTLTQAHLKDFFSIINTRAGMLSSDTRDLLSRHLLQLAKLHLDMSTQHPYAFALLPGPIDLVQAYWTLASDFGQTLGAKIPDGNKLATFGEFEEREKTVTEKLALKGLLIIRACARLMYSPQRTFRFKSNQDKVERQEAEELFKSKLFTNDFALQAMVTLVTKFFVLSEVDLRDWAEDWEDWENKIDSHGDEYLFSIRPCAEKLFLDLMLNFKSVLTDPLLKVFYEVATPQNNDILFKDSIYTAIALAAPVLCGHLDFDTFLTTVLVEDVKRTTSGSNILRRSIVKLISEWVTVKISAQNRPLVYQIFDHFLNPNDSLNDQVVRISAGRHLKYAVDNFDFEAEAFAPYAPGILGNIMLLISQVDKVETQMLLIDTISITVEQMGSMISPIAEDIVKLLPKLWESSGDQHLMKQAILTLLVRIVTALNAESQKYHGICMPLIQMAVEPGSDIQVYLIDEALDLWLAILAQTPKPVSQPLLDIATRLPQIYQLEEGLLKALRITESYLLLCPDEILSDRMKPGILRGIAMLLNRVKNEIYGQIIQILEYSIRFAEALGGETGARALSEDLVRSDVLPKLIEGLHKTWAFNSKSDPSVTHAEVTGIIETEYFNVLSRLTLAVEPQFFLQVAQAAAVESLHVTDISWLFKEWFDHFGNIGHPSNRKLNAMALTKLMGLGRPYLEAHLEDLMSCWTEIVTELREDAEERGGDSLVLPSRVREEDRDSNETPEQSRRNELSWSDPTSTMNISQFIKHYLDAASTECGGREQFVQIRPIDNTIARSFGALSLW